MQILRDGVFEEGVSTQEHIERLSNPENEITPIDVTNLVTKFAVDYILTGTKSLYKVENLNQDEFETIIIESLSTLTSLSNKLIDKIKVSKIFISPEIFSFTKSVSYQISMLIDFPKTISLVLDILSRKIHYNSNGYNGIDLGTGTGILLLAQYIQARRNGYSHEKITNIGVELSKDAAIAGNELAGKLGFGKIINGDTTDPKVIESIGYPYLSFVSNENLPNSNHALSKEPFIENIVALKKAGHSLLETELFPRVFYFKGEGNLKPGKIDIKDDIMFQRFLNVYNGYKDIKVPYIEIGGEKQDLVDIGGDIERLYFTYEFLLNVVKRWY